METFDIACVNASSRIYQPTMSLYTSIPAGSFHSTQNSVVHAAYYTRSNVLRWDERARFGIRMGTTGCAQNVVYDNSREYSIVSTFSLLNASCVNFSIPSIRIKLNGKFDGFWRSLRFHRRRLCAMMRTKRIRWFEQMMRNTMTNNQWQYDWISIGQREPFFCSVFHKWTSRNKLLCDTHTRLRNILIRFFSDWTDVSCGVRSIGMRKKLEKIIIRENFR